MYEIKEHCGAFLIRHVEQGHTEPASLAEIDRRFGREFAELVVGAAPHWLLYEPDAMPEEAWEPLPVLQPITTPVRAINMTLFAPRDGTAA